MTSFPLCPSLPKAVNGPALCLPGTSPGGKREGTQIKLSPLVLHSRPPCTCPQQADAPPPIPCCLVPTCSQVTPGSSWSLEVRVGSRRYTDNVCVWRGGRVEKTQGAKVGKASCQGMELWGRGRTPLCLTCVLSFQLRGFPCN